MKLNDLHQSQVDEGVFTSLVKTGAQLTKDAAAAVTDKVKAAGAKVKAIYQDKKSMEELNALVDNLGELFPILDKMEKESGTIFKRDPEVAKEMELFAQLLKKTIETLESRRQLSGQAPNSEKDSVAASDKQTTKINDDGSVTTKGGAAAEAQPGDWHVAVIDIPKGVSAASVFKLVKQASGKDDKTVAGMIKKIQSKGPTAIASFKSGLEAKEWTKKLIDLGVKAQALKGEG